MGMSAASDPTKPSGRLSADDAGALALSALRSRSPEQFSAFEVSHVAYSTHGELGPQARWVVLCEEPLADDDRGRVVVELTTDTGSVLRVREPVLDDSSPGARILQPRS